MYTVAKVCIVESCVCAMSSSVSLCVGRQVLRRSFAGCRGRADVIHTGSSFSPERSWKEASQIQNPDSNMRASTSTSSSSGAATVAFQRVSTVDRDTANGSGGFDDDDDDAALGAEEQGQAR
jgi:hypothetical protein